MTVIDDEGQTRRFGLQDAVLLNDCLGMENFEEIVGVPFDEAIEGFDLTPNGRKIVLHAFRQLQLKVGASKETEAAVLNMLMNGGEVVESQPRNSTASDPASPLKDGPQF